MELNRTRGFILQRKPKHACLSMAIGAHRDDCENIGFRGIKDGRFSQ